MPRNISFALTTEQIRNRTKTVTRRLAWLHAKPGDVLNACVKCMGLKPGEKIERLGQVRITRVSRELLRECTDAEATREGFPAMTGGQFVSMFCLHMDCTPDTIVTRIEFEYLP